MGRLARAAADTFSATLQDGPYASERVVGYLREVAAIADTLEGIAGRELAGEAMTEEQKLFLKTVLYNVPADCAPVYTGWYARLFYTGEQGLLTEDLVVADVHTQPTDAAGEAVGRVLHAGTGPLNLAVVVAPCPDGTPTAFAGPVMSYYEHVTFRFDRLTDEEWGLVHAQAPSFRPGFTRLYLAAADGRRQGAGASRCPRPWRKSSGSPYPTSPVWSCCRPTPTRSTPVRSSASPKSRAFIVDR